MNLQLFLYALLTGTGIVAGVVVLKAMGSPGIRRDGQLYSALPALIVGAIIGAKIPVIASYGWHKEFLWTGKSYLGALLGAFIAINLYKALLRRQRRFGDRFVVPLCVSAGIGKIGCFVNGCCGGIAIPPSLRFGALCPATYPAPLMESGFQFSCGILFFYLFKKNRIPGAHFTLYMLLYMSFRFLIEFIRTEPKLLFGLSVYQWTAVMFVPVFSLIFFNRTGNDVSLS